MRDGPSRLISTAESSGESKATVAAEWITTSQLASVARSSAERPSPSRSTSPLIVVIRRAVISSNAFGPPSSALSRSKASFLRISLRTRSAGAGPLSGAYEQHQLAARNAAEQPFDEGGADESGRSGHRDPLAGELLSDHGRIVYHLVDDGCDTDPPDPYPADP